MPEKQSKSYSIFLTVKNELEVVKNAVETRLCEEVIDMVTEICNKFIDIKDETCEDRFFEMMR